MEVWRPTQLLFQFPYLLHGRAGCLEKSVTAGMPCTCMHCHAVGSTLRKHAQGIRLCCPCMHSAKAAIFAHKHTVTCYAGSEPPAGCRQAREAGQEALPLPVQAAKLRTPRAGPHHLLRTPVSLWRLHKSQALQSRASSKIGAPTCLRMCCVSSAFYDKSRAEATHTSAAELAWQPGTRLWKPCTSCNGALHADSISCSTYQQGCE